jgi:hypothetical protein
LANVGAATIDVVEARARFWHDMREGQREAAARGAYQDPPRRKEHDTMTQFDRRTLCENFNHRRAQPSFRHCSSCGDVVNAQRATRSCSAAQHDAARRDRGVFCGDCGTRLIDV